MLKHAVNRKGILLPHKPLLYLSTAYSTSGIVFFYSKIPHSSLTVYSLLTPKDTRLAE
jgi:hypothetical protein